MTGAGFAKSIPLIVEPAPETNLAALRFTGVEKCCGHALSPSVYGRQSNENLDPRLMAAPVPTTSAQKAAPNPSSERSDAATANASTGPTWRGPRVVSSRACPNTKSG